MKYVPIKWLTIGCWMLIGMMLFAAAARGEDGAAIQDSFSGDLSKWNVYGCSGTTSNCTPSYAPVISGGALRLVPGTAEKSGVAWLKEPVAPPFTVSFKFRISGSSYDGADGIVFMFNKKEDGRPPFGGFMGFAEGSGYGIEFDTYRNLDDFMDPPGNHVALIRSSARHGLPGQQTPVSIPSIEDGSWHEAKIIVNPDKVAVYLDNMDTPAAAWTGTWDTTYDRVGFASATGSEYSAHYVDDVKIEKPSGDASLSQLVAVYDGQMEAVPLQDQVTSYEKSVGSAAYVSVTAVPAHPKARVGSGEPGMSVTQKVYMTGGRQTVFFDVTAENGSRKTYDLTLVNRSSDARLADLSVSGGVLLNKFVPERQAYGMYLGSGAAHIEVRAATADPKAVWTVTGATYTPVANGALIDVAGVRKFQIAVTAESGRKQTYTFEMNRHLAFAATENGGRQVRLAFREPLGRAEAPVPAQFVLAGTGAAVHSASFASDSVLILQLSAAVKPEEPVEITLTGDSLRTAAGAPVTFGAVPVATDSVQQQIREREDNNGGGFRADDLAFWLQKKRDVTGDSEFDAFDIEWMLRLLPPIAVKGDFS